MSRSRILRRGEDFGCDAPEVAVSGKLEDVDGELVRDGCVEGQLVVIATREESPTSNHVFVEECLILV